ncbi:hypothetical protein J437_LFUL003047 [Ladona fulva]|uniref:DUF4758 domain-containing protein n=1 Tax=Ladona fulva TaxID=123851 RepID=A0A8K0K4S8_LADFU|nr:hypothetical protein J437_LFUL003047 [Ladona fulva]
MPLPLRTLFHYETKPSRVVTMRGAVGGEEQQLREKLLLPPARKTPKPPPEPVIETRPPPSETPLTASTIQPSKASSIAEAPSSSEKTTPPPPPPPPKKEVKLVTPVPPPKKESTPAPPPKKESTPAPPPKKENTPAPPPKKESTPAPPPKKESTPAPPKKESKPTPAKQSTPAPPPSTSPAPIKVAAPSPPVILSSVVEVRTSGGAVAEVAASDLEEAEEESNESGAVIGLKPSSKINIRSKTRQSVEIRSRVNVVTQTDVKTRVSTSSATPVLKVHHHNSRHHNRPGKSNKASTRPGDDDPYPTGLVTKMGGTMVVDGITTVHETSVVGTFISGKYAQILQSTSHIYPKKESKPAIHASPSQRILKTAAPDLNRRHTPVIDATPAAASTKEDALDALPLEALFPSVNTKPSQAAFSPTQRRTGGQRTDFLSKLNRGRNVQPQREEEPKERSRAVEPEERKKSGYGSGKRAQSSSRSTRTSQSVRPSHSATKQTKDASIPRVSRDRSRFGRTSSSTVLATVSVFSDSPVRGSSSSGGRRYNRNRSGGYRPTTTAAASSHYSTTREPETTSNFGSGRRGFKPRSYNGQSSPQSHADNHGIHPSQAGTSATTTSLYKFKLARPTGRWQYKTSPKPRISIRRQSEEELGSAQDLNLTAAAAAGYEEDDEEVPGAVKKVVTVVTSGGGEEREDDDELPQPTSPSEIATTAVPTEETINVEISTPADFSNLYYEIATIKSPYTFQVGTVKNTRFITVTSTHARNLEPSSTVSPSLVSGEPLTENILGATATQPLRYENLLPDASIATLPAVTLTDPNTPTPPLETMTETFNTTQLLLKTHVLPIVRKFDGDVGLLETATTSHMTLVQSYHVTRLVTAIKTLPPAEYFHFVASKRLKEFNTRLEEAGSELLESELEVGENDNEDDEPAARLVLPPDLDLANIGLEFDVTAAERARKLAPSTALSNTPSSTSTALATPQLSPEQLQQLALLRLLNPAAAPQVLTTSRPVLKLETLYESHVIPFWNGLSTLFSTISRPIATVSKTEYEYGTTIAPAAIPSVIPPAQPLIPNNPFLPQPQFTITSQPVVQQTMVTSTDSKILRLTFGAKTVYSTLYSTTVVPTVVTSYVTTSAPVHQVVAPAFPGYFPGGYPGFPTFVG